MIFCIFQICGCSGGGLDGLYPVNGQVLLDGQPVEGANVFFAPVKKTTKSRSAAGLTDSKGNFKLTTLKTNDGIYPGTYRIYLSKSELADEAKILTEEERQKKYTDKNGIYSPPHSQIIPEKYINPNTSGFNYAVKKGKNKNITLNMKSKTENNKR
ncbi:MAG: carboxypeptidase-like regulatory domain-containing protein [Planctomycetaceae bacterium]|nr:carboxypeptidase-like regulatory domain-containing protein [Planctomycetaceae bacterium]